MLTSAEYDLVINVGDIKHKLDLKAKIVFHNSTENISGDVVPSVSKVGI